MLLRSSQGSYIFCSFTQRDDALIVLRQHMAAAHPAHHPPAHDPPSASAAGDAAAAPEATTANADRPASLNSDENPHVIAVFVCAYGKTAVTLGHWYVAAQLY